MRFLRVQRYRGSTEGTSRVAKNAGQRLEHVRDDFGISPVQRLWNGQFCICMGAV